MRRWIFLMLLVALAFPRSLCGQTDPEKACRLSDGKLIFTLDNRWNPKQKALVMKMFDLDSTLVVNALKGEIISGPRGEGWVLKKLDANRYELSKAMKTNGGILNTQQDVAMLDDRWIEPSGVMERESVPYGINRFTRFEVFSYKDGVARFFLPGKLSARQIILSGSFNGWSTSRAPMQKTDSGWIASVRLKPGKYTYKYIVDGRWMPDPFNRQQEDDYNGDYNSIVFCYNHTFYLRGFQWAQQAWVTGTFNDWNITELRMQKINGGWIRAMYLREGTHSYKFLLDGHWLLDPANPVIRNDGAGHENSAISIGDTLYFRLHGYTSSKHVFVAGTFNGWNQGELEMDKNSDGWELAYVLRPGNYEYKFIRDGVWMTDPLNPYSSGPKDLKNSFMAVKPNHVFILEGYPEAKSVIVTGTFNGWSPQDYRMVLRDGKWIFPIWLPPGKHLYKFIIDGTWMTDPGNKLWEENEYGTGNSIVWIEI